MKFLFPAEWYNAAAKLEDSSTPGAGYLARHQFLENLFPSGSICEQTSRIAFSQFIELSRRNDNLSIEDLANKSHIEVEDIVKIENKDYSYVPTLDTISRLAQFWGVNAERLAEFAGLARVKSPRMYAQAVTFIATTASVEPLSQAESKSLQEMHSLLTCNDRK
ncbi:MAG: helix-turn-helix transcriptional regulator [Candidatus Methylopumilus sp.]|jgi:transcriptional regulator with XRE-family HTH domain